MPLRRRQIAWRVAQDLADGAYVNLGIGLPTLVSDFIRRRIARSSSTARTAFSGWAARPRPATRTRTVDQRRQAASRRWFPAGRLPITTTRS